MLKNYIKFCIQCIILLSVFSSLLLVSGVNGWYSGYAFHSDWKNKKCDYVTNYYCYKYYNGESKWYRVGKFNVKVTEFDDFYLPNEIIEKLNQGKVVSIGADRYALMGISSPLFPKKVLNTIAKELLIGKVKTVYLKLDKKGLLFDVK